MSRSDNYSALLVRQMTPELKYRIEKIARLSKKTVGQVVVDFLKRGANTSHLFACGC